LWNRLYRGRGGYLKTSKKSRPAVERIFFITEPIPDQSYCFYPDYSPEWLQQNRFFVMILLLKKV